MANVNTALLHHHLIYNHYPPLPTNVILPIAVWAIEKAAAQIEYIDPEFGWEYSDDESLNETYADTEISVLEAIEHMHLDEFVLAEYAATSDDVKVEEAS